MACTEPREMLHAYLDDELVGEEREAMDQHLRSCEVCAAALREVRGLRRRLASIAQPAAPAELLDRIRAEIAKEAQQEERHVTRLASGAYLRGSRAWAAGLVAAGLVAVTVSLLIAGNSFPSRSETDVLAAHLRAILQDNPLQIASSDSHTVKPWFNGRVDFAPSVKDLTAQGFPLIGGRLDYAGSRKVGVLVYKRRKHVVNIYMWAMEGNSPERTGVRSETLKGHNMLTWSRDGVTYTAVSDLNATELAELQRLL